MAETIKKVVEIDVKVDNKGISSLDESFKSIKQDLDSIGASAKQNLSEEGFKKVTQAIQGTEQAAKSTKTRLRELEDEMANIGDVGSPQFQKLAREAGVLKDKMNNAKSAVKSMSADFPKLQIGTQTMQAVGGAAQGAAGAMALFGGENEVVTKSIQRMMAIQSIMNSVTAISNALSDETALGLKVRTLLGKEKLATDVTSNTVTKKATILQKVVTAGQWLWNAAISANPIGLIIAAIIALIAMGAALFSFFASAAENTAKHTAAVDANENAMKSQMETLEKTTKEAERAANQELAMAKASGMSADAIRKLELKLVDAKIARERDTKATLLNIYAQNKSTLANLRGAGANEDIIKRQAELTAESGKNILKQNEAIKSALSEKKDIHNKHLVELKTIETKAREDAKNSREKSNSSGNKTQKDNNSKELTEAEKQAAELVEIEAKRVEDAKKILEDFKVTKEEAEKEYQDSLLDQQKQEELKVTEKYSALIETAKEYGLNTVILEKAQKAALKEITDKYDLENLETERIKKDLKNELTLTEQQAEILALETQSAERIRIADGDKEMILLIAAQEAEDRLKIDEKYAEQKKKLDQDNVDQKLSGIKDGLQLASNLASLFAGKDVRQQKRLFEFQKKANMAVALIDTYKGAQSAYASTVGGPIIKGLAAGVALTAGLMNVKKIANTEFQAPAPDTTPPPTSLSGGNVSTPNFNIVGNANQTQTDSLQPQKVYVVSKDVTTQQELDRNTIATASN